MSSKVRTVKRQSDWSSPVQAEPERFSGITTKRYYLVKWIAMITMLIDHLAFLLHSDCGLDSTTYIAMRTIGRIAFPLFCFEIVECVHFTKHRWKHLLRLFLLAVVSELPFNLLFAGSPIALSMQNVCFTFVLIFFALIITKKLQHNSLEKYYRNEKVRKYLAFCMRVTVFAAAGVLAYFFSVDYTWKGVALAAFFSFSRNRKHYVFWYGVSIMLFVLIENNWCVLAAMSGLFFLFWESKDKTQDGLAERFLTSNYSKWVCRFFYPAHIILLLLVRAILLTIN